MGRMFALRRFVRQGGRVRHGWRWLAILPLFVGCYAPLFSHGIPARQLPDEFRMPIRTAGVPINYASLTQPAPPDYRLGAGDVLEVTLPELIRVDNQPQRGGQANVLRTQVMASGDIQLPLIGPVNVRNMNLLEAQNAIIATYRNKKIGPADSDLPINVFLAQKATISVVVLGAVNTPGVHVLPKYENDVGHALAAAGGFNDDADDQIEVHRRVPNSLPPSALRPAVKPAAFIDGPWPASIAPAVITKGGKPVPMGPLSPPPVGPATHPVFPPPGAGCEPMLQAFGEEGMQTLSIPLRSQGAAIPPDGVILQAGDVVVVPNRRNEVFFVVGKLAEQNFVRFTVRERERELGGGFLLPKERDIDVVTAVAMAGYIDPIDSPTTVTVHRTLPNSEPLLIHVDLIKARYDRQETVLVQAGDIIYLNPDGDWWFRRTFDRVVPDLILLPFEAATFHRWIPKTPGR